eukprot:g1626.t1
MISAKNTVAVVVATLAIVASAMETPECQCEYGDFWCSSDDTLKQTFNCSGTPAAKRAWKNITDAQVNDDHLHCDLLKDCVRFPDAAAMKGTGPVCVDSCYDFCWKTDVGDCADMDDSQIFCVYECMNWCVGAKDCGDTHSVSTPCENACSDKFMIGSETLFVDYAMCMADCTPVPIAGRVD